MNDWKKTTLGLHASFYKGRGLPKSDLTFGGKNRCIHYGELFTKFGPKIEQTISATNIDASDAFLSKYNDVLMPTSDVTPTGLAKASCITSNGVILGGDILVIRGDGDVIDGVFLSYVIRQNKAQIQKLVTGSTVYHLYGSDMAKFEVRLPPLAEQQKIAAVLSDIDALIETQEALIAKKKDVKAATMELLLTGKKRLPGFNDEWIKTPIKNMATIGRGRVISHAEISRSMAKEFPVYSSQTSNDGIMGYIDSFDFEGEYVTWTTDGANAGRVFHRTGKFNCTNVCGALSCLPNVSAMFLASALNRVTRFSVSTNLANPKLMNGVMGGIRVDMPQSLAEQVAISALLHDFQLEIDIQETLLLKQKLRKSSVMHKLLTGEIRLP